eukprot:m.253197 g.253197  ORF g.253197 m.253197 type:complete len:142 (+) comp40368_c2_seq9:1647-2072(+)
MEPETLGLEEAVRLAIRMEEAAEQTVAIASAVGIRDPMSQVTSPLQRSSSSFFASASVPLSTQSSMQQASSNVLSAPVQQIAAKSGPRPGAKSCPNCAFESHRGPQCPAIGQKCRKCNKTGHYSRCCRSSGKEGVPLVDYS